MVTFATILTGDGDIRVEILPSLFDRTENDTNQMNGILYSLGLVFFEILSRGERPAELEQKQPGETTTNEIGTEEVSEVLHTFRQAGTTDPAGELSMYQDLLSDFNWSDDDSTSSDTAFRGVGPRKKRTQNENYIMCSFSVEPLKQKGVPVSLCDLVVNMLDSTNGILRKDETYNDISEVRDDLQLMLDKPSIYLYDQEMGRLSTSGLQFGGMFGRNAELSIIIDAYRRTISGDSEVVTIYGQSGTGKSLLACEFGKYVVAGGGILLSGKFDQLQQGKPLSALASAFNQYCGILLQSCELASLKEMLAGQLNAAMGREAFHLAKLIPNLAHILSLDMNIVIQDDGCANAQKRLQYLLCRFVEVISSIFAAPVTLFLDDLQWADSASIAAVNQLLLRGGVASQTTHFFFLGCYREGEVNNCNPLWKSLCNNSLVNARSTQVKLDNLAEETLSTMVSETLCLSPRLTRSLSSMIYHKTKGNPLFVSRLMISLSKEGLLRPSLSRRRWEWDEKKIQCQKLSDDVAIFLTKSMESLSDDVKSSLCVLSCFGSSAESTFIKTLEKVLKMNILTNLDEAVEEGLLDKKDGLYHFSHDRIQEAAYNMIKFLDRRHFHFKYGMALVPLLNGQKGDSNLLTAVNQLNLAGPESVQEKSQNITVADLNLQAGKQAMEMSDFSAAYAYFDNGISFLRKKHWDEHYALSLELFDLAATCALTNGDFVSLKLLSEQVIEYGRTYADKLNILYLSSCALAFSKLPESIEKGIDVLANLGIELRGHESNMEACVQETKVLLSFYTDDEILNTRPMTDPTMMIAMKFLGKLGVGMCQIMPKSSPYVMQRIIQLSLLHGMSPVSPIGFVYLGSYIAKLGDIREGYHFVKLSRSLLNKVGSGECAGEVICADIQVRAYVEPIQATLEYHNEGFAAAMTSGDIIQATINNICYCTCIVLAGVNLQTVQEKCAESEIFMYERKMLVFIVQLHACQHSVFKLIGTDEKPTYVSAEEENIIATNTSVRRTHYFWRAYTSFMFRLCDDAKHYTEKNMDCIVNTWSFMLVAHSNHAFYIGLISFWLARKTRDGQQWHETGKKSKLALKKWAETSKWTFENKWYLLEAEESHCNNDFESANSFYEKAISSAKDHKVRSD